MKKDSETAEVSLKIKNTGRRTGSEIVQIYIGDAASSLPRPPKELKAFRKINLSPNESTQLKFELSKKDFSFYDPRQRSGFSSRENLKF